MAAIRRMLEQELSHAAKHFPALVLTGPRRAGKTYLFRKLFPKAPYVLLEDPDIVARFRADPGGFLDDLKAPVILDEVQNVPEIFAHVRARIDRNPRKMGQYLLTGSQEAPLMQGVTESMAGRAAIFSLLPFAHEETKKVSLLHGGFPEVALHPRRARLWFASYIQTYLERDVRNVTAIRDLSAFRRFIGLLASRHGQVLNRSDIASPLGVSVPTLSSWLSVLEITGQILLVPPFFENFGKRLIKSPKIYWTDSGLACHLLGIESPEELKRSPFRGALFEGFVAAEIVKAHANRGRARDLYYFRDQQGLEVDFVVPRGASRIDLIEVKATRSVAPLMAKSLLSLAAAIRTREVSGYVVCEAHPASAGSSRVAPNTRAATIDEYIAAQVR